MELLVATWTMRMAIVAALAVGGASYAAGTPAVMSVDRALAAAVLFTFAGRWLVGFLEPPERRLLRARQKREARRAKAARSARAGAAEARANKALQTAARSTSTVSRTA